MELSSPRFKALAVTLGLLVWFFVISSAIGFFTFDRFFAFLVIVVILTQIFSIKLSKALDAFAILNTKLFLGILFLTLISLYGILFRFLKIDLLRLKIKQDTYWLDMEQLKERRIFKQY